MKPGWQSEKGGPLSPEWGATTTCFNDHDHDQTVDIFSRPRAVRLLRYQQTTSPKITVTMSGLATKQQSLKIFEKLKTKPANKVSAPLPPSTALLDDPPRRLLTPDAPRRFASTAAKRTRHGHRSRSASTYASTARPTTATSASTFPLCARPTSTVRDPPWAVDGRPRAR